MLKKYVSHFMTTHAASTIVMNLHLFVVAGVKSHCILAIFLLTITFTASEKNKHVITLSFLNLWSVTLLSFQLLEKIP